MWWFNWTDRKLDALRVLLVIGYLQCAGVLMDKCSTAPSGIRLTWSSRFQNKKEIDEKEMTELSIPVFKVWENKTQAD